MAIDLALALPSPFKVPAKVISELVVVNSTGVAMDPAATNTLLL